MTFEGISFRGTFRSYQQRVLDNVEQYLADGKVNIVAAPGSGKTVLGLELIRRLGESCLILSPTTAIREQWGQRFSELFATDEKQFAELFSTDLHDVRLVNSITYQALYSAMEKVVMEEEGQTDCSDVDLLKMIKDFRIKTICLDEAHHLKNEWQKALEKFIGILDNEVKLISLTATPPYDSETSEWKRYYDLCGEIDEEIFVPELVAQKNLCPHQDYIYFNYPTKEEAEVFSAYHRSVVTAIQKIGTLESIKGIPGIIEKKEQYDKIFEAPAKYIALLILLQYYGITLPKKTTKALTGKRELPKLRLKYAETALQFLISEECELLSAEQKEEITDILKEHQIYSKRKVSLILNEALRRDLISSVGKLESIKMIAQMEYQTMGNQLRMLILTDYIKKENRNKIATEESFHSIHVVSIFETIRRANDTVNIGVLSGNLIILPDSVDLSEINHKKSRIPGTRYWEVDISGSTHKAIEYVGTLFEKGEIQILIGTKSLLGEGWDAPCINTLILASFVGSYVLSNQMRGRAIRIDKNNPDKTSNVWHLVTLEPKHVVAETVGERLNGRIDQDKNTLDSWDYEVLKRRFDSFMGPNYETGEIESGMERVSLIKPPYDEKGISRINKGMLQLAAQRKSMQEKWKNELADGNFSVVAESQIPGEKRIPPFLYMNWIWYGMYMLFIGASTSALSRSISAFARSDLADMRVLLSILAESIIVLILLWKVISKLLLHLTPGRSLTTLGNAVYQTLRECGIISSSASIHIEKGYMQDEEVAFFMQLRGATMHDQNIFNTAITELLSPIENPRYVLIQKKLSGRYQYKYSFACPSVIGRKKEYVEVLAKRLKKSMGNMETVYAHSEEGRKLVLACRRKAFISKNAAWSQDYSANKKYVLSRWE